jgi:hypothetical protein
LIVWMVAAAFSAPQDVLLPVAVGDGVDDEYRTYLASSKKPEASLICRKIWEDRTQVCLQTEADGRRRFVSSLDLGDWGVSEEELWASMATSASSRITEGLKRHPVTGDDDRVYWSWSDGTNWASGALLVPHIILRVTGLTSAMVAMPTKDTLLVWATGDELLNQIMAVGAVEISVSNDGLDPGAFRFTRDGWQEGLIARPINAKGDP